jgi:hypothetical protein
VASAGNTAAGNRQPGPRRGRRHGERKGHRNRRGRRLRNRAGIRWRHRRRTVSAGRRHHRAGSAK